VQRTRLRFALLLALPALAITACGDDEGATTSAEHTAGHQPESGAASTPPGGGTPASSPRDGASGQGKSTTPASGASGNSPGSAQEPTDLPESHDDSGGGTAQFRGRGDNSVQETGSEAGDSEFEQAAAALHGYLDAQATGRWKAACSYMASEFRASVEQLGGPCAAALEGLSGGPSPAAAREAAAADAGALRIDGKQGFLLFHGAHRRAFFMPMAREGGSWKIAALAASELH
jgi:hypothetical protein